VALSVVDTPGETMLTTVQAVKDELQIPQNDSGRDAFLERLIRQASGDAVSFCRRPFARQRVRETNLQYRDGYVMVTLTPVEEVHSLTLNGQVVLGVEIEDADTGTITGSGNALLGLGEARWWNDPFGASLPRGSSAVVEYTGGFVVPADALRTLPYDVEAAVISLVKGAYEEATDLGDATIARLSVDDITVQYDTATGTRGGVVGGGTTLQTNAYDRLERYRRVL